MGGKSKKAYAGTKYYMGMHMVLCYGPVDKIQSITADDKLLWSGSQGDGSLYINQPNVWGGEKREGGVVGTVDVAMGSATQIPNTYLQAHLGANVPAFRDVVSLIWRRVYYSMNPYLKPWSVRLKRVHLLNAGGVQWYDAKSEINGDLNPAHIIRECLTDPTWGLGYTGINIDSTSFEAAADQLYTENFGLSFLLESETTIETFIQEVLGHISARLFASPTTGLFHLRLIRDDYDINNIPVFNESNTVEMEEFDRKTWTETINNINVVFSDRATAKTQTVTVHDIANIQRQGAVVSNTTTYRGITNGDLALRVATRDLSILSKSLSKLRIKVNRDAFDIESGDVFRFEWAAFGLGGVAYRVMDIDYGDILDGTITISALEDNFSLPLNSYVTQQPSQWAEPIYPALDVTNFKAIEANYWWVQQNVNAADISTFDPDFSIPLAVVGEPGPGNFSYDLYSRVGGAAYEYRLGGAFTPTALTTSELIREYSSTITYNSDLGVNEDDYLTDTYAYVGDEMVHITAINKVAKTITVNRGIFDTVPEIHSVGTLIYFLQDEETPDTQEYINGESVNMKAITFTGSDELAVASATPYTIVTNFRYQKPYPIGSLKVDGSAYPQGLTHNNDVVLTWAHRDRTLQTAYIVPQTDGSIGPEVGTTYDIEIRTNAEVLLRNVVGLTGNTYTYLIADELSDLGGATEPADGLIFRITTQRDGLSSFQTNTVKVLRPLTFSGDAISNNSVSSGSMDNDIIGIGNAVSNNSVSTGVGVSAYADIFMDGKSVSNNSVSSGSVIFVGSGGDHLGENALGENGLAD